MLRSFLILVLWMASGPASAVSLLRGMGAEPDSLDIHQAQGLASLQVLRDLHEGLLTFDQEGELIPGLAASWTLSEDGRQYRFLLKENARWSDGETITANDFVRGWHQALTPGSMARTASLLAPLQNSADVMKGYSEPAMLGVRAESSSVLVVNLTEPSPWFLEVLTHPVSYPMHHSTGLSKLERPVSGPYQLFDLQPNAFVKLVKNPAYHDAGSVRLDEVVYLPIEDPGTELSRYRAGEIHITETIPPGRHDWLAENLGPELHISPYLGSFWLGVNLKREPLGSSVELRRALALAIDRETLTDKVLGAGEIPAWSVVPPGLDGYRPLEEGARHTNKAEREAQAVELYRRAGYGDGRDLRVEIRFNSSTQHRRMAVAVAAMWKQVLGVNAELMHEEWKVFVNNRRMGLLTEVFRGGWIADYADPTSFLDLFRSGDPLNNTFYTNAGFDLLLDQAAERTGTQRMQLLHQAETLLMRDMPVIPLYYYVSRHLVKPGVTGFRDNVRDIHLSRYLGIEPEQE